MMPPIHRVIGAVYTLLVTFALLSLIFAAGHTLTRRYLSSDISNRERLQFSVALGTGVVATGVLVLGAVGLLDRSILIAALFGAAVLLRREFRHLAAILSFRLPTDRVEPLLVLALATGVCVALVLIVAALPPSTDWDSLTYHLALPQAYVDAGRIHLTEASVHAGFIGLAHMLYIPLLAVGAPSAPAVLSALYALLLGIAVWHVGLTLFDRQTAQLAFVGLWGTTSILFVAATPRVELFLAYLVFTAHLALLKYSSKGFLVLGCVLLGFSGAIKYHGFLFAVALAPWIGYYLCVARRSVPRRVLLGAGCLVAGTVAAAPILIKNTLLLGAPFYPYGSEQMLQPWLAAIAGSTDVPASVTPSTFDVLASTRSSFNLRDLILAPGRISAELEAAYYFTSPLLGVLGVSWLAVRNRVSVTLLVPAMLYLALVIVPHPRTNLRYLIPAVPALTIVAAHLLVQASARASRRHVRGLIQASLGAASLPGLCLAGAALLGVRAPGTYFSAEHSITQYFATVAPDHETVRSVLDAHVGEDDKVLLLFEGRRLRLRPTVLEDGALLNWPLLSAVLGNEGCLPSDDVQYVLVHVAMRRYFEWRGVEPGTIQWHRFEGFAARCLEPVANRGSVMLYRTLKEHA